MRIAFYGGETAGCVSLLSLLAAKQQVTHVYTEDEKITTIATLFNIPIREKKAINTISEIEHLKQNNDLLVCCHARKILKKELVDTFPCVNLHPCLYAYKGGYPIQRLIAEKNPKASVACHWMVEKVDAGETIIEEFKIIENLDGKNEAQIYNDLYPLYAKVLVQSLQIVKKRIET